MKYEVRLRPGCYSDSEDTLVSRHITLLAAVRKARQSDRWQVEIYDSSACIYAIDRTGVQTPHGHGLYGYSAFELGGTETLAEAVSKAERRLSEVVS